ncbi:MAG: hypothetical protein K0R44_2619, partial [Thermomicrobiales bacterium]|nr:hypothetical protein [Thermomicrobiales bacterium]
PSSFACDLGEQSFVESVHGILLSKANDRGLLAQRSGSAGLSTVLYKSIL